MTAGTTWTEDGRMSARRALHCVVAGGSLVGLSAAIALSGLGIDVTVLERSPSRAGTDGGGLGVDVALLQQVTGIGDEPRWCTAPTATPPPGTCCRGGWKTMRCAAAGSPCTAASR
jgi:cation diffusion facilitator CzcD-associated flavoprotein CzcO